MDLAWPRKQESRQGMDLVQPVGQESWYSAGAWHGLRGRDPCDVCIWSRSVSQCSLRGGEPGGAEIRL
jgi:hypothetical protein